MSCGSAGHDARLKFYLGMSGIRRALADAMAGVDFVFHAAALKQVPSCEFFPIAAVHTNSLGTENVLNAAMAAPVTRVVTLSTDKAVYPINVMGVSKALVSYVDYAAGGVAGLPGAIDVR